MLKSGTIKKTGFALLAVLCVALVPGEKANSADLQEVINAVVALNDAAAASQARIEKVDSATDKLLLRYRDIQRQTESLRVYSQQVEKLVMAQRDKLDKLRADIEQASMMGREITPLMLRMLDTLENFVKLDVPFLLEERNKRLDTLRKMMKSSEVTDADKYRRVLEAYQVEADYARNLDAYRAELDLDGKMTTVEFLRVGRVALIYRTIDGKRAGVWDQTTRSWHTLSSDYFDAIHKGFRIAQNLTAPDLMLLPIPAAKEVTQ